MQSVPEMSRDSAYQKALGKRNKKDVQEQDSGMKRLIPILFLLVSGAAHAEEPITGAFGLMLGAVADENLVLLERDDGYQCPIHVPLLPAGYPPDAGGRWWINHQHLVNCRGGRIPATSPVRLVQVGSDRAERHVGHGVG